jgi:molybdopterin adenylyltransferase
MGTLSAICVSARKGERKQAVESAFLKADFGLDGDAHAGPWHRQISLLSAESADTVRQAGLPDLQAGDFAENLLVSGVDLDAIGLGSTLRVGTGAILSITQIGKTCHAPCIIQAKTGECIMPKQGLFARVLQGGAIAPGDRVEPLVVVPRSQYQCVVLTISDRCSRGEAIDTAGPAVARLLEEELHAHLYRCEILPDEQTQIAARLRHYADGHSIDLVVTAGGTGFSPRDVTPEAVSEVVQRPTPGLDEAMRAASLRLTPHAMLSRACSGIRGSTLIVALPGSERGATENLRTLLPALGHGLAKLRGDPSDCAPPRSRIR